MCDSLSLSLRNESFDMCACDSRPSYIPYLLICHSLIIRHGDYWWEYLITSIKYSPFAPSNSTFAMSSSSNREKMADVIELTIIPVALPLQSDLQAVQPSPVLLGLDSIRRNGPD